MRFNVSGLLQESVGATRRYQVDETVEFEGVAPERVYGDVEMLRTKAGVLVRAHLGVTEAEVCSRCLKPVGVSIKVDFEEEYQATVDPRTGASLPPPEDADAFVVDARQILDLSEAVRQYREVSTLMQPLCRTDCQGLCQTCGKDLNLGPCDCAKGPLDTRWAALASFRRADQEGKE